MSIIIAIKQENGLYLITDCGSFDPSTGNLVAIGSKVALLRSGVAMAWRGSGGDWTKMLRKRLLRFPDFDSMLPEISGMTAELYKAAADACGSRDADGSAWRMEVWLAGMSKATGQPELVWLTSQAEPFDAVSLPPFSLRMGPAFTVTPAPSEPLEAILGRKVTMENLQTLEPIRDGLALAQALRRPRSDGHFCVAGGRAEMTCVWPSETTRYVLCDWGDTIGRPCGGEEVVVGSLMPQRIKERYDG